MRNSGQPSRIAAHVAEQFAPWTGLPRFSCGTCGAVFVTKADKLRHKRGCKTAAPEPAVEVVPEPCDHEDLYTDMRRHVTPRIRALANAEWDAMDAEGRLPADWPQRRAEIEARFAAIEHARRMKEERHG